MLPERYRKILILIVAAGLSSCATLPKDAERPESFTVIANKGHLAELLDPYQDKHPGKSGFLLLDKGDTAFAARMAMAELAEETLVAQYFIWKHDQTGLLLAQAVLDAADRGVQVRLLLDDFDIKGSKDKRLRALEIHPNIELRIFNPFANRTGWVPFRRQGEFLFRAAHLNHRMHNKIFMVDGQVAIVGGRNIGDEYFGVAKTFNFRDLDLLGTGPIAAAVGDAFDHYWNSDWAYPISALNKKQISPEAGKRERQKLANWVADQTQIAAILPDTSRNIDERLQSLAEQLIWADAEVIYDDPDKVTERKLEEQPVSTVTKRLSALGDMLTQELLVETAYFIPRESGVEELEEMVAKGVDVRVLTNSLASNNHASAHSGYRRYRKSLVEGGIEMFELSRSAEITPDHRFADKPKAFLGLHSKAAVFDRKAVFIGTLNLDPRSMVLNTEMALLVNSEPLAEQVASAIEIDMAAENSWKVSINEHNRVRWTMQREGIMVIRKNEPEASLIRKAISWIAAILPIEGQL